MEFLAVVLVFAAFAVLRWRLSGRPLLEGFAMDLARLYARLWHRWCGGRVPLPPKGPALVVANHTGVSLARKRE